MTDEELKDLIRDAAHDTTEMSDLYYEVLTKISEEDIQRCNELLGAARVSVTWDGDKPSCGDSTGCYCHGDTECDGRCHDAHRVCGGRQGLSVLAPAPNPLITPDQMQDGKRYAVTVVGRWDELDGWGTFNLDSGGDLDDVDLQAATRIEEIGDHDA